MKKAWKIFIAVIGILVVTGAGFAFFFPQSPLYLLSEECPPIAFPMEGGDINITDFNGFGICDWGEEGVTHNGIDFSINGNNLTGILAVASGTVRKISESENPYSNPAGMLMFNIYVTIARGWEIKYVIEPFAVTDIEKQTQRNHIYVVEGQEITEGDRIARLLDTTGAGYEHLHFMLVHKSKAVCAYLYSSTEAQTIYESIAVTFNKTICCDNCSQVGCQSF